MTQFLESNVGLTKAITNTFSSRFKVFYQSDLGPSGTCYEGGKFDAELLLPDDYPMTPPKVVFDTKIYHPNIGKYKK